MERRRLSLGLGIGALLAVIACVLMREWAARQGVHCPDCDRRELGASLGWWQGYFRITWILLGSGGLASVAAIVVGSLRGQRRSGRLLGVIALVATVVVIAITPR